MSEEDIQLLENGYSVSESEDNNNDGLSLNSLSHRSLVSPGLDPLGDINKFMGY